MYLTHTGRRNSKFPDFPVVVPSDRQSVALDIDNETDRATTIEADPVTYRQRQTMALWSPYQSQSAMVELGGLHGRCTF